MTPCHNDATAYNVALFTWCWLIFVFTCLCTVIGLCSRVDVRCAENKHRKWKMLYWWGGQTRHCRSRHRWYRWQTLVTVVKLKVCTQQQNWTEQKCQFSCVAMDCTKRTNWQFTFVSVQFISVQFISIQFISVQFISVQFILCRFTKRVQFNSVVL